MRRLNVLALTLVFLAESHAWAWQNPLVSVSTPTSQAVTGGNEPDSTATSIQTLRNVRKKKRRKFEEKAERALHPSAKSSIAFSGSLGADHTGGFRKDIDPVSTLNIGLNLKFNDVYRIGVSQAFSKVYFVTENENEVKAEDTAFSAGVRFYSNPEIVSISQSFSATAPVSQTSRQYEIMSRVATSTTFTFPVVDKIVTLALSPGATYTFNKYATTPVSLDGGGRPLQQSTIGLGGSLGLQLTEKWDMNFSASYKRIFYEKSQYENETSDLGLLNPPEHAYAFSAGTSYTFFDAFNVSISVAQADRVEKEGGIEVVVYDETATLWSAGMTYSF